MPDSDLDYCKIVGRIGLTVGDGPDAGENPDILRPDPGATVVFEPLQKYTKVDGATPPVTLGQANIVCWVDPEGYLTYPEPVLNESDGTYTYGNRWVWLVDLGSDKVNPVIARDKAAYRVTYKNVTFGGTKVDFPTFTFHPTPAIDNDLTLLAPVPVGGGQAIVVGPKGDPGEAGTVDVGTTTTSAPGTPAQVQAAGTPEARVLNFVIPKGDQGPQGINALGADQSAATVADYIANPTATRRRLKIEHAPNAGFAYAFMEVLERDSRSLVLAVSGDSKSNGSDEWVHLWAQKIAARFPKFAVVIKHKTDSANTYQADFTIQTGTGGNGNTLTIYNWSQSGAGSTVGFDTQAVMDIAYPVAPDLFLIATAANDDFRTGANVTLDRLMREGVYRVAAQYPSTVFAVVLMNPHTTNDAFVSPNLGYQNVLASSRNMVRVAESLGLGLLNLQRVWFERTGGYADLLSDTKHPNPAGSEFLAQTAFDQMVGALTGPTNPTRLRVPVMERRPVSLIPGFPKTGSPAVTLQATYGNTFGVAFDSVADEAWIFDSVELESTWQSFGVEIDWCPQTNAGGDAYFELRYTAMAPGGGNGASQVALKACTAPASASGKMVTSNLTGTSTNMFSPAFTIPATAHRNGKTTGDNYPLMFRLTRLATNALDTLEGTDALVHRIRLIRNA